MCGMDTCSGLALVLAAAHIALSALVAAACVLLVMIRWMDGPQMHGRADGPMHTYIHTTQME